MLQEEGWERGQDDEDLFELAMHERQWRDYKSGVAEERFNKSLEDAKAKAGAPKVVVRPVVEVPAFDVEKVTEQHPSAHPIQATATGKLIWRYDVAQESTAPNIGQKFTEGQPVCYIQTYYGIEPVNALFSGKIVSINAKHNENVQMGQILGFIE